MVALEPINRGSYQIRGDTECHRQGDGYERTLVLVQWDQADPRRMARACIRVDRTRPGSYARIDVWVSSTGWNHITAIPQEDWWDLVPGYERGGTHTADHMTLQLVDDLVDRLIEIGI